MSILPRMICRFNTISTNMSARAFINIDMLILKFVWKKTGPRIGKAILKKENKVQELQ